MRLFDKANYPFISWRRRAYVITALMIGSGLAAMVYNYLTIGSWLNYGVDFSGGTLAQVEFDIPMEVDGLRGISPGWEIARLGGAAGTDEFAIRMPTFVEDVGREPTEELRRALDERYGPDAYRIVRTEAVGPKVGAELQQRALIAILISFVLTLIYIAFRFEWRFGVASLVPTAHDIIVTLGFLAIFRTEISVGTVAAFLTIVGYSLNDTIIVFDRVRENLPKRERGAGLDTVLDRSINETLPRTVLTSGTTLITLYSLYMFGGVVIRDFAQVLILGIALGTFSSVFVAAPALWEIDRRWPPAEKRPTGPPPRRRRTATA